jgi:hypothetical protein
MPKSQIMQLRNAPRKDKKTAETEAMTANVTNDSSKDVHSGMAAFHTAYDSQTVPFGYIGARGGTATGTCYLNSFAVTCIVHFTASDGSTWSGIAGDGSEFDTIDIGLDNPKRQIRPLSPKTRHATRRSN